MGKDQSNQLTLITFIIGNILISYSKDMHFLPFFTFLCIYFYNSRGKNKPPKSPQACITL